MLRRLYRPLTVTMVLANVLTPHATRPRHHHLAHGHHPEFTPRNPGPALFQPGQ